MLKAGIVGMPNVGKSTLFNALTRTRNAEAANYPFCTIDPNVGMVTVPDSRLDTLSEMSKSTKVIPTAIEFVDIAGLVEGASEGAGLGNKFLANIREVDAIVQVVRCFENDDIIHELGTVDPTRDIEIINSELILADIAALEKRKQSREKKAKSGDKESKAEVELISKLLPHLDSGKPSLTAELNKDEKKLMREFFLLSSKPTIFACNVNEDELSGAIKNSDSHPLVSKVKAYAAESHGAEIIVISARIEEELVEQGLDFQLPIEHFRDEQMQYVFRSPVELPGDESLSGQAMVDRIAGVLLAYEAAFGQLGDMKPPDEQML